MAVVKYCSYCQSGNPAAAVFCSCCGTQLDGGRPDTPGPSYAQVFEEPFRRLENMQGTARLDAMLRVLDKLDSELSDLLGKTPERHKAPPGIRR